MKNREFQQRLRLHSATFAIKRGIDFLLACALLLALVPIFLVIAIAIKVSSRGTVFYLQERVGRAGKPFSIYKFRTMVEDAEHMGSGVQIEDDDPRITTVGECLRKWSIDELPQLINIIKGEMSFVGPRPTLQYQVDEYSPQQRKRLDMKPGITGWAQVNGRNNIPWDERIELDVWYIEHWSLWLDFKIVLKTVKVLFTKNDIYSDKGISYDFRDSKNNTDDKHAPQSTRSFRPENRS